MHQTRAEVSRKIPIPRKGTKYVARSFGSLENSVPVVIAVRDMLKLARTAAEVKKMIHKKLLKINGREIKDHREALHLFNILHAGKNYILTFSETGKFILEETSHGESPYKVIGKKMLKNKKIQVNLHDGFNLISDKPISVNDTVYLNSEGKIAKHVTFEKGKNCFIIKGKYLGRKGKILNVENGKAEIKIENAENSHFLEKGGVIII